MLALEYFRPSLVSCSTSGQANRNKNNASLLVIERDRSSHAYSVAGRRGIPKRTNKKIASWIGQGAIASTAKEQTAKVAIAKTRSISSATFRNKYPASRAIANKIKNTEYIKLTSLAGKADLLLFRLIVPFSILRQILSMPVTAITLPLDLPHSE